MSFVYPRTISVKRIAAVSAAGNQGYRNPQQSLETSILTGLPASIQFDTHGSRPLPAVPDDTQGRTMWRIFIPKRSAALGQIQKNDIVVDDQGTRYQVEAPYWNSLGYALRAELLAS